MVKSERKRTMVYSNVNKKADYKSASRNNELIDLDNEVVIGLKNYPKPKQNQNNKKKNYKNSKKGQADVTLKNRIEDKQKVSRNPNKVKYEKEHNSKKNNKKTSASINKNNNKKESKNIPIKNKNTSNSQIILQDKLRRKKIRAIKKMSVIALMAILLIGGIVYFFLSPVFNVKAIEVINNNYITSEQIISSSGIKVQENMFKFSKKDSQNNILSNPYIEKVNISRNLFTNKVQIDVQERTATLMLEYGNSYVYINNQGYILEISTTKLNTPILKGYVTPLSQVKPGNRLNKEDLERLETVLNIMETASSNGIDNLISQIDIKDKDDYIMFLEEEDKTVYLGSCSNLSTQMLYVKKMIETEKGVEGEFFVNMDLNKGRTVFREKV